MFYDHERALGILIAASSGSDIIKVGHAVESKLEELKTDVCPPEWNATKSSISPNG